MNGLFSKKLGSSVSVRVPLVSVSWNIRATEGVMELEVVQTFVNKGDVPIEPEYIFPAEEDMAVCDFTVRVNDRLLEGKVVEKGADAPADGSEPVPGCTLIYDPELKGSLKLGIGSLAPNKSAAVTMKIVKKLDREQNSWCIRIPASFSPRNVYYNWTMKATLTSVTKIVKVNCPSHNVKISSTADSRSAFVFLEGVPQLPDKDFVLFYSTASVAQPVVYLQKNPDYQGCAALLSFCPVSSAESSTGLGEYLLLLDCSGSMKGKRMTMAKEAVGIFLKQLPPKCLFNVYLFGSSFRSFFPSSVELSPDTLSQATKELTAVKPEMGGTEIYTLLEAIFKQPTQPGRPRSLFLLTDGAVDDEAKVISLVRAHKKTTRVHTFGIGTEASPTLIRGVAEAGNGRAEFAKGEEAIAPKVESVLREGLGPALSDITVTWPSQWEILRSSLPATVYFRETFVAYAICEHVENGVVKVTAVDTATGSKVEMETKVVVGNEEPGKSVYKLAAGRIINDYNLEKKEEIEIATKYGVISPNTAFAIVEKAAGAIKTVAVGVPEVVMMPVVEEAKSETVAAELAKAVEAAKQAEQARAAKQAEAARQAEAAKQAEEARKAKEKEAAEHAARQQPKQLEEESKGTPAVTKNVEPPKEIQQKGLSSSVNSFYTLRIVI